MKTKAEIAASVRARLEALATPIDFADLEARGVLKKEGTWYRLLKPRELPPHARQQITSTVKAGGLVKFRGATKKDLALLARLRRS